MNRKIFTWYDGYFLLLSLWIGLAAISAIFFSLASGTSFSSGLFESVSALTLTNASLIGDSTPLGLKMFRALLQLPGSVIFTVLNTYSFLLITGSMRTADNRITTSASSHNTWNTFKRIVRITLTVHALMLSAGLMLLLPAIHSFYKTLVFAVSAMTSGGFLPFTFDGNSYIQLILSILMMTGFFQYMATTFLWNRQGKRFLFNSEYKLFAFLFISLAVIHLTAEKQGLSESIMASAAFMSGTGIRNLSQVESLVALLQFAVLVLGGLACSTAGGIKLYRIILLFKSVSKGLKQAVFPKRVFSVFISIDREKRILEPNAARHSLVYILLFLILYFGLSSLSPPDSSFRFTLAFLNYGGNLDWAVMSSRELFLNITGMILGRFAIYPLSFLVFRDMKRRNPS